MRWHEIPSDDLIEIIKAHLGETAPVQRFQVDVTISPDEPRVTLNDVPVVRVAFDEGEAG